jgi:hypothetical protein
MRALIDQEKYTVILANPLRTCSTFERSIRQKRVQWSQTDTRRLTRRKVIGLVRGLQVTILLFSAGCGLLYLGVGD